MVHNSFGLATTLTTWDGGRDGFPSGERYRFTIGTDGTDSHQVSVTAGIRARISVDARFQILEAS